MHNEAIASSYLLVDQGAGAKQNRLKHLVSAGFEFYVL